MAAAVRTAPAPRGGPRDGGGLPPLDATTERMLEHIITSAASMPRFLQQVFAFLHSRTDLYIVDNSSTAAMGFRDGQAERLVLNAFRSLPYKRPDGSFIVPAAAATPAVASASAAAAVTAASTASAAAPTTPAKAARTPGVSAAAAHAPSAAAATITAPIAAAVSTPPAAAAAAATTPARTPAPGGGGGGGGRTPSHSGSMTRYRTVARRGGSSVDDEESSGGGGGGGGVAVQVPVGNGGVGANNAYWWTQALGDAMVYVPLPPDVRARDVEVAIDGDALRVAYRSSTTTSASPVVVMSGRMPGKVRSGSDAPMWTLEAAAADSAAIRGRPIDPRQPPFDPSAPPSREALDAGGHGLFAACKLLALPLEKAAPSWWRSILVGHPEIDANDVDSTQAVSDYDPETQAAIRKIAFDQARKASGLPTSDEERAAEALAAAGPPPGWDAAAAPPPPPAS